MPKKDLRVVHLHKCGLEDVYGSFQTRLVVLGINHRGRWGTVSKELRHRADLDASPDQCSCVADVELIHNAWTGTNVFETRVYQQGTGDESYAHALLTGEALEPWAIVEITAGMAAREIQRFLTLRDMEAALEMFGRPDAITNGANAGQARQ